LMQGDPALDHAVVQALPALRALLAEVWEGRFWSEWFLPPGTGRVGETTACGSPAPGP
jgi:hypothetical protein